MGETFAGRTMRLIYIYVFLRLHSSIKTLEPTSKLFDK